MPWSFTTKVPSSSRSLPPCSPASAFIPETSRNVSAVEIFSTAGSDPGPGAVFSTV